MTRADWIEFATWASRHPIVTLLLAFACIEAGMLFRF